MQFASTGNRRLRRAAAVTKTFVSETGATNARDEPPTATGEGQGNIYAEAEQMLRELLGRRRNREACLALGIWLLRKHGPHGYERRFSVPRRKVDGSIPLHQARGFPNLTEAQIRGAVKALEEVGFLVRSTSRFKKFKSPYDLPTLFVFGMNFAALFPAARLAPQARTADVVRSTPNLSRHNEETQGLVFKAPLIVATKDRPFGRPVIPRRRKTEEDLRKALAEAVDAKLDHLRRIPLPKVSAAVLATLERRR